MPYRNGNKVWNATDWTEEMISSLKKNFHSKTNQQLADMVGVGLTVLRNKTRDLGLKRMELEYWCPDQVQYLKENYKKVGDVEIMEYFIQKYPKQKGWKRGAIWKKRKQMKLFRTDKEKSKIVAKNCSPGGSQYTIDKNSSSKNMHPKWVAQQIAWRDPEMQDELMKHPDLIEAGRTLIKLNRVIKQKKKDGEKAI